MTSPAAASARARVEQLNDAWTRLLDRPDESVAASLHGDLDALKAMALVEGWRDISLLCSKLEHLVFVSHRHHYDVPMEVLLTVSMALELLQSLVAAPSVEHRSADLAGFVAQIDAVLRDTAALTPDAMGESPAPAAPSRPASRIPAPGEDRLGRLTRQRLAAAATTIYLESIRARGASSLRLRETWAVLRRDISELGRVPLLPRLQRTITPTKEVASARGIAADVTVEGSDVIVSPETALLLEAAVLQLLHNTVTHGLAPTDRRVLRARVTARLADGAVSVLVEDDGVGFEAAAGEAAGEGLASLRSAITREGGTMVVRSVRGRGTAVAITIVDPTMGFAVRTFRSSDGHLLFAVDASWTLVSQEWTSATALDPIAALGLRPAVEGPTTHTAVFRRGDLAFEIPVRSHPALNAATRICPTATDTAAEVVLIGETEALLLRLDRLGVGGAQSTVPPRGHERPPPKPVILSTTAERPQRREAGACNVLLLDGDSTWLVLTRAALLHRGFDVRAVSTLSDLGEALERYTPDIVLADPEKLEISADELARQVKHVRPLVPIMFFNRVLPKSVGPDELARALRERCLDRVTEGFGGRHAPHDGEVPAAAPRPTLPSARRH